VRWAVCSGVSLREAASNYHNELMAFQNTRVKEALPTSHSTVALWILQAYREAKPKVSQALAKANSKLTLSFDGWTANNKVLDLLGVVVHYLDENHERRAVVVGLRDTLGSHTGANMADHLLQVIQDFALADKIAYFIADNASNNDVALKVLSTYLPSMQLDPVKQRLRCAGHIYNLVCKAILYGVDSDCLADASQASQAPPTMTSVSAFEATINGGSDDEAKLIAWRKKGPVGKLHNTVIHIKENPARRLRFESKQRELVTPDEESAYMKIYRVVVNGGIRWNSTYLMIERAMKLRDAIHLYQDDHLNCFEAADYLTSEDWRELADLQDLLKPIYDSSLQVQARNTGLHEVLTSMDYILAHLENAKKKPSQNNAPYFTACVNLGWWKLDQYYLKTDLNPAYIMAVFLHP
jgi:hypothetical protein